MHVDVTGSGPRVVLVHGSVSNGRETWAAQLPLADRFTLVVPNRPGFPPNPDVDSVDFEEHAGLVADLLEPGDHLAGHSYGGVIALYAAGLRGAALRSLTVVEPPAFGLARGRDGVDELVARLDEHWATSPRDEETFLRGFIALLASNQVELPSPLPPALAQGARTLMVERSPVEADPPLDEIARLPLPKLVVSGGHSAAFDAVCDVLEERLGAERAVLRGAGHGVPRLGAPFNDALAAFLARAA
jgi:pimeloyl-ACP methyl ester carboxylesterase